MEVGVLDQLVKVSQGDELNQVQYFLCLKILVASCGSLPSISDGLPGTPTRTTFGGTVTYSCNTGYILSGSVTVTCQASGSWSTRPTCEGEQ